MRVFLAGIMQGSLRDAALHKQDYRGALKRLLEAHWEGAEIYDPLADHGDSLNYEADHGRSVFLRHNAMCREVDVLLAFVPAASMGTAIEMWEAFQHGGVVLTISPLAHNWAVRFLSHEVFADYEVIGIDGTVRPEAFLLKMIFTAATLGAGYKGGEIVPSMDRASGNALGWFAPLSTAGQPSSVSQIGLMRGIHAVVLPSSTPPTRSMCGFAHQFHTSLAR